MKARDFDLSKLDVEAFVKAQGSLQGTWPLSRLERLASSVVGGAADAQIEWEVRGELRAVRAAPHQVWLHVKASTGLMLECQRCLAPVACEVRAERSFLFVHGENAAAELDAESEDDVLALTRSLDVQALIEDELLLEIPLVPRHEACPQPLPVAAEPPMPEDEKPHPFAGLAALKRGGLPN